QLVKTVCYLLMTAPTDSAQAYDSLYALSNPAMAAVAAQILVDLVERVVYMVIAVATGSNRTARRNFCILLVAFDTKRVNELLKQAEGNPETGSTARALRRKFSKILKSNRTDVCIAGYASASTNLKNEIWKIQKDVKPLVAVMLAKKVEPPLAIGLF